ncbi:MAG: hypothetical protein AYK18_05675 [Theionarchaea archaeon DG-70]|nr:MAG: hypothetical protein AYK18_05675 [Theionarchaea archaeon DG-70]
MILYSNDFSIFLYPRILFTDSCLYFWILILRKCPFFINFGTGKYIFNGKTQEKTKTKTLNEKIEY